MENVGRGAVMVHLCAMCFLRAEIPQVAIFTKIDEACAEIKKDIRNVYRSKVLQERVNKFLQEFSFLDYF